ncbi:hypothetical protein [Micromonospora terminaliae]|nr:hypothetical protein [Micromonospora terminaliae]
MPEPNVDRRWLGLCLLAALTGGRGSQQQFGVGVRRRPPDGS